VTRRVRWLGGPGTVVHVRRSRSSSAGSSSRRRPDHCCRRVSSSFSSLIGSAVCLRRCVARETH